MSQLIGMTAECAICNVYNSLLSLFFIECETMLLIAALSQDMGYL